MPLQRSSGRRMQQLNGKGNDALVCHRSAVRTKSHDSSGPVSRVKSVSFATARWPVSTTPPFSTRSVHEATD
jgi:hypothetical protein